MTPHLCGPSRRERGPPTRERGRCVHESGDCAPCVVLQLAEAMAELANAVTALANAVTKPRAAPLMRCAQSLGRSGAGARADDRGHLQAALRATLRCWRLNRGVFGNDLSPRLRGESQGTGLRHGCRGGDRRKPRGFAAEEKGRGVDGSREGLRRRSGGARRLGPSFAGHPFSRLLLRDFPRESSCRVALWGGHPARRLIGRYT